MSQSPYPTKKKQLAIHMPGASTKALLKPTLRVTDLYVLDNTWDF